MQAAAAQSAFPDVLLWLSPLLHGQHRRTVLSDTCSRPPLAPHVLQPGVSGIAHCPRGPGRPRTAAPPSSGPGQRRVKRPHSGFLMPAGVLGFPSRSVPEWILSHLSRRQEESGQAPAESCAVWLLKLLQKWRPPRRPDALIPSPGLCGTAGGRVAQPRCLPRRLDRCISDLGVREPRCCSRRGPESGSPAAVHAGDRGARESGLPGEGRAPATSAWRSSAHQTPPWTSETRLT